MQLTDCSYALAEFHAFWCFSRPILAIFPAQAIIFIVPWLLSAHFLGGLQSLHKTTTNTLSVVCPSPHPHPLTPPHVDTHPLTPHTYTNTPPLHTHRDGSRAVHPTPQYHTYRG